MPGAPRAAGEGASEGVLLSRLPAAEFELRRLQRRIGAAEDEVAFYRREVEGGFSLGGSPAYKKRLLKWAEEELDALEARLRLVLSDDAVKGEPR